MSAGEIPDFYEKCESGFIIRTAKVIPHFHKVVTLFPCVEQKYTKFANFTGLYFPQFTSFRKKSQFYLIEDALSNFANNFFLNKKFI